MSPLLKGLVAFTLTMWALGLVCWAIGFSGYSAGVIVGIISTQVGGIVREIYEDKEKNL